MYILETIITFKRVNIHISPKSFLMLFCNPFLLPKSIYLLPKEPLTFLSLSIILYFLKFYIKVIIQCVLFFCMAFFAWHKYFEIHPCCCVVACIDNSLFKKFTRYYCWVVLHCMDIPKFVYLFTCWWFGLLLILGYYK